MKRVSVTNILAVLIALWVGAYCAGCATAQRTPPVPAGVQVPIGAYRFEPYEFYRQWYKEVAACVGEKGDFDDLEFWGVPANGFFLYGGGLFAGYYDRRPDPDRIYLVDWDLENEGLVKHEMAHPLADPEGQHPVPPYDYCAPLSVVAEDWRR